MNKATARLERESLNKLKSTPSIGGFSGASEAGVAWRLRVIGRGKSAFFQLGDRAMYIEIDARIGAISRRSIRCWDDETVASEEELCIILDAVRFVFRQLGFHETLID